MPVKCEPPEDNSIKLEIPEDEKAQIIPLITRIAQKGVELGTHLNIMEAMMDLTAVHLNGRPMDFLKLSRAIEEDPATLAHDLSGIKAHIDRNSGELVNHFMPRCALSNNWDLKKASS